jgi:hypothetical protein
MSVIELVFRTYSQVQLCIYVCSGDGIGLFNGNQYLWKLIVGDQLEISWRSVGQSLELSWAGGMNNEYSREYSGSFWKTKLARLTRFFHVTLWQLLCCSAPLCTPIFHSILQYEILYYVFTYADSAAATLHLYKGHPLTESESNFHSSSTKPSTVP